MVRKSVWMAAMAADRAAFAPADLMLWQLAEEVFAAASDAPQTALQLLTAGGGTGKAGRAAAATVPRRLLRTLVRCAAVGVAAAAVKAATADEGWPYLASNIPLCFI